jgi:hypothetical protein
MISDGRWKPFSDDPSSQVAGVEEKVFEPLQAIWTAIVKAGGSPTQLFSQHRPRCQKVSERSNSSLPDRFLALKNMTSVSQSTTTPKDPVFWEDISVVQEFKCDDRPADHLDVSFLFDIPIYKLTAPFVL